MKIVSSPIPARIILFVAALLLLKSFLTSITEHGKLEFSLTPLSLFILFNVITVAVIVRSHKPSIDENGVFPYLWSSYEGGAFISSTEECSDVDDHEDDTQSLDGYLEDDDDDDDDDSDDSWNDEEEYDDDLQKRIEDFIARVINGWREERLRERDCQ